MRIITWLLLFLVAFFVALVLVLTFMQPEFKVAVGAQILTIKTRPIPVYLYVLGAFVAGLLLGFLSLVTGYVRAKADAFRKGKLIRELEQQRDDAERKAAAAISVATLSSTPGQADRGQHNAQKDRR